MEEKTERISISLFDLHCLARLLQSAITQHGNIYKGCQYCLYPCSVRNENGEYKEFGKNSDFVMGQLFHITGVGLSPYQPTLQDLEHEKSPCLDNKDFSSEEAREKFFNRSTSDKVEEIEEEQGNDPICL